MLLTFFAQASPSTAPASASQFGGLLIPYLLIFVAMYYVFIRPARLRQKEAAKLVESVKTGDRVVTASGIHGLVANVKDRTLILKIADNVKIEMEKSAISTVLKSDSPTP